ncbi:MAG: hypothetical protein H6606_09935 [Flavobacteriales bacterium]|nr:hypothetical protein [Flavobacteriales bacterium]
MIETRLNIPRSFSPRMWIPLLMLISIVWMSGCYYDIEQDLYGGGSPCNTTDVNFSGVVNPIIANNCLSCHNAGLANGNVRLDSYTEIKKYADNGKLLSSIKRDGTIAKAMPPDAPLGNCRVNQIEVWINAGAPNN